MSLAEQQEFACPYCMAVNDIEIDAVNDLNQQQIVDCQICCQPIEIMIVEGGEGFEVIAKTDDE